MDRESQPAMACSRWPGRISVTTYNPLSMSGSGRWDEVSRGLPDDVICLQGTQVRRADPQAPFEVHRAARHHFYSWHAGQKGCTNRSTGVSIGLSAKKVKLDQVIRVWSPPEELQGRAGALRVRTKTWDVCIFSLYFAAGQMSREKVRVAQKIFKWVETVLEQLPGRCSPVIGGDLIGRVGRIESGGMLLTADADEH